MSAEELHVAYTTDNAQNAEILRVALQNEGIPCEIDGAHQAGLIGVPIFNISLLVRASDLDNAKAFIAEHKSM
jgi:hypothetical protein